jgi:hypothetical protein
MKMPVPKALVCSTVFSVWALAWPLAGIGQIPSISEYNRETEPSDVREVSEEQALPDAPSALLAMARPEAVSSSDFAWNVSYDEAQTSGKSQSPQGPGVAPQIAKKYALTIKAGETAQPLSAGDKVAMAFLRQATLGTLFSTSVSAGWNHIRDGRPHYGSDSPAFGQRWGASLARQSSQTIFSVGVLSPLLHDDPRYYVMGPTHSFKKRAFYAATRVFVTRTDSGHSAPNIPLLAGMAGSQALTNAYYPDGDRSASRVLTSTLTSIATRMGTQQFKEFSAEIRQHIPFLKKR